MKRERLTKRIIDATKAHPTKEVRLWDADVKGLFLRIRGSSRTWWFQYSRGGRGRNARVKIDVHGNITVEQAREEAKKLVGAISDGRDPVKEHRADLETIPRTVEELAKAYLAHGKTSKGRPKKPRSVEQERGLLGLLDERPAPEGLTEKQIESRKKRRAKLNAKDKRRKRTILDVMGKKLVNDVDKPDIERLKLAWSDTPVRANRALALLSAMFSFAIRLGYRTDQVNPVKGVEKNAEAPRKFRSDKKSVYLDGKEFAALSKALTEIEREGRVTPYAIAAIRLLAFTGARASEVLTLKWADVFLDENKAKLPDSKTGPKHLQLSPAAKTVLNGLMRIEGNPYVIPGRLKGTHLTLWALEEVWSTVRKRAGLDAVRLHDLRHSFASSAIASGSSLMLVAGLLGHADIKTTQRYAHLTDDALQAAVKATGASIAKAMKTRVSSRKSNVSEFPQAVTR